MDENHLFNRKNLKAIRSFLRNKSTSAEAVLWNLLKSRNLKGGKFRRQHSIDKYIVDFYCPSEKLIIEPDGNLHGDYNHPCPDASVGTTPPSKGWEIVSGFIT